MGFPGGVKIDRVSLDLPFSVRVKYTSPMRYSRLFGQTLRNPPHEVKSKSQILLIQAGYLRALGQGLFSYLPLGIRVLENLKKIIRAEMERLGGQEVQVPLVNPYVLWRRGGRASLVAKDMVRFTDRQGHDLVLAPTHEEAMVDLVKKGFRSYRDLPIFIYQFQTKFRDEIRTRYGLIRAKEFVMKDGYSFHRTFYELNNFFPRVFAAYQRIFAGCGIDCISAESGVGYMGGEKSYEFLVLSDSGDDYVVICDNCGYRANRDIAKGIKEVHDEELAETERIHTPGCETMERLAEYVGVSRMRLAKSMVYRSKAGFVMAVVRGDYEINEEKLSEFLGIPIDGLATDKELADLDLVPGYLSPLDKDDIRLVVDDSISRTPNLIFGSNKKNYHVKNVNFGRDFFSDQIADIAAVKPQDRCLQCHHRLRMERATEVGNIFKLNDFYSRAMNLHCQDDHGEKLYPFMGSYGIGLGRLLSCIVEVNSDDRGIIWNEKLAPFRMYLMGIGKSMVVRRYVEDLYLQFEKDTLLDDRHESPGVKFKDADLIGIPLRIVVTAELLEKGKVEFRERRSGRRWQVASERVADVLNERWAEGEDNAG